MWFVKYLRLHSLSFDNNIHAYCAINMYGDVMNVGVLQSEKDLMYVFVYTVSVLL